LSIAALGTAADKIIYTTAADTAAETALTAFARTILDDANQAAVQATLAVVPGTNVQVYDATLTSIAALGTAADKLAYTTGVDTWAETAITAFGRSLIDDANAAAGLATLGASADTHLHDGATLQHDAVNSDGGAFSFTTTGAVTFSQAVQTTALGVTRSPGYEVDAYDSAGECVVASTSNSSTHDGALLAANDSTEWVSLKMWGTAAAGNAYGQAKNDLAELTAFSTPLAIGTFRADSLFFGTNDTIALEIEADQDARFYGGVTVDGTLTISTVADAAGDVDKFLVLDAGNVVDYRTGAEVLSDIGGATAAHLHNAQTLQNDGITPDSGTLTIAGIVDINTSTAATALDVAVGDTQDRLSAVKIAQVSGTAADVGIEFSTLSAQAWWGIEGTSKELSMWEGESGSQNRVVALTQDGDIKITDGRYIGSFSDPDAISIAAGGDVTLTQDLGIGMAPTTALQVASGTFRMGTTAGLYVDVGTNDISFHRNAASYINQSVVGGTINFRTSNAGSNDTTALILAAAGGGTFAGVCRANGGFSDGASAGIDGSFTNGDGDTVTVSGGIITDIS